LGNANAGCKKVLNEKIFSYSFGKPLTPAIKFFNQKDVSLKKIDMSLT